VTASSSVTHDPASNTRPHQYPNKNDDPPQPPRTKASRTEVTRRLITPNRVEVRRTSKVVRWFLHDNSPVEQNVDVPSVTVVAVLGVDK
jgi:hypothetical protein